MAAFEYRALDLRGRTVQGVCQGDSSRQVRQNLRERDLAPLRVAAIRDDAARPGSYTQLNTRIKLNELAVITRQFSTLLESGLTIEESLSALAEQSDGHQVKSVLSGIKSQVMEGRPLAQAIGTYPRSFPEIYQASVAAGENSGTLDTVMLRLADYIEARQGLQQRVGLALVYPIILTIVAVLIVAGLLAYVVPQVVKVFDSMGQAVPFLTQILIAAGGFLRDYGLIAGAIAGATTLAWHYFFRWEPARIRLHRAYLVAPGIRKMARGLNAARMSRTLAIMVGSGVPLLQSMEAAEGVLGNLELRANLREAAAEVSEGVSIHRALSRHGHFPPLLIQMVASGESSGRLGEMLDKAASAMERELEARVAVLVGLFEPFLILVMGAVVLIIVLAILLPIFDLNQLIA